MSLALLLGIGNIITIFDEIKNNIQAKKKNKPKKSDRQQQEQKIKLLGENTQNALRHKANTYVT